ncbi:MAG: hypothetical protein ACE5FS_06600 [Paracoccaceae bacterium]
MMMGCRSLVGMTTGMFFMATPLLAAAAIVCLLTKRPETEARDVYGSER